MSQGSDSFVNPLSPPRSKPEALRALAARCLQNPLLEAVLTSLQGYALILDPNRQTLAANLELLDALNFHDACPLLGKRPGEVLGCVRVPSGSDGCGTSPACAQCGALLTILASQAADAPAQGECLMTIRKDGKEQAHEFAVRVAPLALAEGSLLVFVMQDISTQKRLEALEKVFFHDMANTLQGLRMRSELLGATESGQHASVQQIAALCHVLDADITHHRLVMEAERGHLQPHLKKLEAQGILDALAQFFHLHPAAKNKRLTIQQAPAPTYFYSDHSLLLRVLANAVINALEATPPQGEVRVWFHVLESRPAFSIHNAGAIPEAIQRQIFQRSFSTKGARGRGLGTYSMKLLGEAFLGGAWRLQSNAQEGTCFTLLLPLTAPAPQKPETT